MCHFSLANTKISSLLLVPMSLNTMHLGIVFFKCILFEVHGVSRSINLCTSLNLKNFSHYFFKYFYAPSSLFPLLLRRQIPVCGCLMPSQSLARHFQSPLCILEFFMNPFHINLSFGGLLSLTIF